MLQCIDAGALWSRPNSELGLRIEMGAATRRTHGDLFGVFLLFTSALLAIVSRSAAFGEQRLTDSTIKLAPESQ